jgi:hypothetical protein
MYGLIDFSRPYKMMIKGDIFFILDKEFEGIRHMKHYNQLYFPNVVARFETFLPWLSSHNCLTLTFEELKLRPEDTFKNIYNWVWNGKEPTPDIITSMRQSSSPMYSKTYNKSQVNQWPYFFNEKHRNAFEKVGSNEYIKFLLKNTLIFTTFYRNQILFFAYHKILT